MKTATTAKILTIALLLAALLSSTPFSEVHAQDPPEQYGSISGRVVNDKGEPVADADVRFVQVGYNVETPSAADTNENGEFIIDGLRPGSYRVYASRIEEGYPHTLSSFYQDDCNFPPYVTVIAKEVSSDVVVHIHKGAWLEGTVVSDSTDQPVRNAEITLRRADDPRQFHSTGINIPGKNSSGFKILVPTVPFTIEVTAPGYGTWTYDQGEAASQRSAIQLEARATKKLVIRLRPSS